jgi:hypothetical protein
MAMTDSERSTMVGVFEDQSKAEQAVNELRSAGFSDDQIGLVVRIASVTDEGSTADEQRTEAKEEGTAAEMIPSIFKSKPGVSRTVVTVKAEGREQEALGILHRNGANNANIPDALEADLAPILGTEADDSGSQHKQVIDARSRDSFFEAPETSSTSGTPPSP